MSSNGNHYTNSDHRASNRYDSHNDRSIDSREHRGRGGYRGSRGHDHYSSGPRGRARGYSRHERHHGGRRDARDGREASRPQYRDLNSRSGDREMSPRASPRDSNYRDFGSRDSFHASDHARDLYREERGEYSREDTRGVDLRDRPRSAEHSSPHLAESHKLEDRSQERSEKPFDRLHRPTIRSGSSRSAGYGGKRLNEGDHRRPGSVSGSVSGGVTPLAAERHLAGNSLAKKPQAPAFTNPWISLLRLGEGKTAGRLETNFKDLEKINDKLSELQSEKIKLTCALNLLDVYAERDALNVEICTEKLDEFTYL